MDPEKLIFDATLAIHFDLDELPLWESDRQDEMKTLRYYLPGKESGMEVELSRDQVEGVNWDGEFDEVHGRVRILVFQDAVIADTEWIRSHIGRCTECETPDTKATCERCGTCKAHCHCPSVDEDRREYYGLCPECHDRTFIECDKCGTCFDHCNCPIENA